MQSADSTLSPSLEPSAAAPSGRRRRHRAKRRRRPLGTAVAVWVGASALLALAGGGIAGYLAHQGGPGHTAPGAALAALIANLFGSSGSTGDGTGAMCRLGDAGTYKLAELVPPGSALGALLEPLMCTIGDDGTSSLAALVPPGSALAALLTAPMCTIGDPGTLALAALAGGDLDLPSASADGPDGAHGVGRDGDGRSPDGPSDQIPPLAVVDPDPDAPPDIIPLAGGGHPTFKPPGGPTPPDPSPGDPSPNPAPNFPFHPFAPFDPGFLPHQASKPPPGDEPLVITADTIVVPEPSSLAILTVSIGVLFGVRYRIAMRIPARKA